MDAFYAAVEQRDDSSLRGKPVIVGGSAEGRGVVATASYEARKFGVRSAMASARAKQLCPQGIFVRPRFHVYRAVSQQVMSILHEYTDLIEPLSLDEAYLDVTQNKQDIPYATRIAKAIREQIKKETELTASAGVAPNKFLAKIASDMNKPDGMFVIRPEDISNILPPLPVRKIPGIGRVTEEKMAKLGIMSVAQLAERSLADLQQEFGKSGAWYYRVARGEDDREVCSDRERKSIGAEDTFPSDLSDLEEMKEELKIIARKVFERAEKRELSGRTITVKVTYADFRKATRSKTLENYLENGEKLEEVALELLELTEAMDRPVRLLGVQISNFAGVESNEQAEVEAAAARESGKMIQLEFPFAKVK